MKKLNVAEVYFDGYAHNYDKRRIASKNWLAEQAMMLPELGDILPNDRVLDVPGGTGRWLEALKERGAATILFDVSTDMLAIARSKADALGYPIETITGDALKDPYPPADWLLSNRFFNKIPLSDVRRVLVASKNAGVKHFVFTVRIRERSAPPVSSFIERMKESWRRTRRRIKRGFQTRGGQIHSEDDFNRMIAECGLTVERQVPCDHYPGRRKIMYRLAA